MNKAIFKKNSEELQGYLMFKRKGFIIPNKKGKGSYNRRENKKLCEVYNG